jgi:replicative DNA helicase
MEKEQFGFSSGYERKILKLFLSDSEFYNLYIDLLEPKYFTNPVRQYIASLVKSYYEKYKKQPNFAYIKNEKAKKFPDEVYNEEVGLIEKTVADDYEYTRDLFVQFMRTQAYKRALQQAVPLLQDGKTDGIDELIKKASETGRAQQDLGVDYFETFDERSSAPKRKIDYIPTLYKPLDDALEGGLCIGTVGCVLALQGIGKSFVLQNFCKAAALLAVHSVYYTFELSALAVGRRLDMSFLKKTKQKIWEFPNKSAARLRKIYETDCKGTKIYIKEASTGQFSTDDMRAHLKMLHSEGIIPKIIFVDYAAIMRAKNRGDEFRFQLKQIYEDLRAIAKDFKVAVWTAHQAPKGSEGKHSLSLEDVGEATWINAISDVIIALNQTAEERKKGLYRFGILKNREGLAGQEIPMLADLTQMRIKDEDEAARVLKQERESDNEL